MPDYSSRAPGVYIEEVPAAIKPIAGAGTSTAGFIGMVADNVTMPPIPGKYQAAADAAPGAEPTPVRYTVAAAGVPQPINSWTEFVQTFGDIQAGNDVLAQAVYGFYNNGGTRCFVARVVNGTLAEINGALGQFESIDEIAIVAAPLPADKGNKTVQDALVAHCQRMEDRFAILDSAGKLAADAMTDPTYAKIGRPSTNPKGYGAFYFPWIQVANPLGDPGALVPVPPSGHIAGIYARSDAARGVHKAPANEVIAGAQGLQYPVSKIAQGPMNKAGVNCIRNFDGTYKVYGARTLASDPQGDPEWVYVNVRRYINYLRESIDEGTQWVVFEPNAPELWSKIRRNIGAFLTTQWAAGALFGATPEQAFYVRCDESTNPPAVRDLGQVITEIGVAVVKPAEFVIFRISQWSGPGQ